MIGLDKLFGILGIAAEVLLIGILVGRKQYRAFPIFSVYILWQVVSDIFLFLILSGKNQGVLNHNFITIYYSFAAIADLLELGVLVEIAVNVLSPARQALQRKILYFLLAAITVIGVCAFFVAAYANAVTFAHPRTFIVMDTTAAILRLITFLLIASFSQLLGLSWKNHVLQLASGLAFYSVVLLVAQLAQSRLHASPLSLYDSEYQFWGHVQTCGYLCTLYFWCYAFVKKEAPRKEFSPQMTKFLVSISGSTKRQSAVLARTRDQ